MNTNIKYLFTILFCFYFLGCKKENPNLDEFNKLSSSLPILKTPYVINCGLERDENHNYLNIDSAYKSTILPENCFFVGRLYKEQSFVTIMCGGVGADYYPLFFTFTSHGQKIDSLIIYGNCDCYPPCEVTHVVIIDSNKTISVIDTLCAVKRDSLDNIIKGSDSTFINQSEFSLTSTGHFIKIKDYKSVSKGWLKK